MSFSIAACVQLIDDKFDMLIHSPLARAAQTAEIVWGDRTGPIHVLPSLREIDLYSFQVFHAIPASILKHILQVFMIFLLSCLTTLSFILHLPEPPATWLWCFPAWQTSVRCSHAYQCMKCPGIQCSFSRCVKIGLQFII
jgi:hypothetical protein